MLKSSTRVDSWYVFDTTRNEWNVFGDHLIADGANVESSGLDIDVVSNGIKIRTSHVAINASAATYIFMAFAEAPFKFSRAR